MPVLRSFGSGACRAGSVLASVLVWIVVACAEPVEAPGGPPDILLVSLDSVRGDALDFRDAATPALTELARRGTIFESAFSGTSWTLPAHVELFTGSPPSFHGVNSDEVGIDSQMPVLGELLAARGYQSAGIVTSTYLWGRYGFARGFDSYESAAVEHVEEGIDLGSVAGVTSGRVVDAVEDVVASADPERPLLLFLHLFDPHYDYVPPAPYDTLFDPEYTGSMDGRNYFENPRVWDNDKQPNRQIGARDLQHIRALYRGEIAYVDSELARVFAALRARGRFDETLVVITADHGEEFFEHGRRGHQQSLFDEVLRIPLLVVPPAREAGAVERTVAAQVRLSDVLPTILDYAGVEPPASTLGRSLRGLMRGGREAMRPVLSTLYAPNFDKQGRPRHQILQALRTPEHKLVRLVRVRDGEPSVRHLALYDLRADPDEQQAVTDPEDPRMREAIEQLEAEGARLRERWHALPHDPTDEREVVLQDEMLAQLVALGYLGNPEEPRGRSMKLPWGLAPPPPIEELQLRRAR